MTRLSKQTSNRVKVKVKGKDKGLTKSSSNKKEDENGNDTRQCQHSSTGDGACQCHITKTRDFCSRVSMEESEKSYDKNRRGVIHDFLDVFFF